MGRPPTHAMDDGAPAGAPSRVPGEARGVRGRRARAASNLSAALLDDNAALGRAPGPALRTDGGSWSHGELAERSGRVAARLREEGVRRGDVVAIALPDSPEWVALFLGAVRAGAVAALAGHHLGAERLRPLLDAARPALVVHDGDAPGGPARLVGSGWLREAVRAGGPDPGPEPVSASDPCYMLLTSGSTGRPRWVVHRHSGIPACLATYGRRVLGLRPGDVTWSQAALASSYGLGNSLYFPLGAGACAWIETGDRSPRSAERACRAGASVLFGVPTGWARLARHAAEGRVDRGAFAGVRMALSAGEPLAAPVWRAVHRRLGLRLVNTLGCSEASDLYLSDRPGDPRPGTVGFPVPGYEVRVAPDGELMVRGASVMEGYLRDPAATARVLDGGWLRTGDLVRREPDGRHTFLGRRGDAFKAGGRWVDPARAAAVLRAEPGVADAVVMGVEDADGVARVTAFVAASDPDGALGARLEARAAAELEDHERPRTTVVVGELPATASGKIDRARLHELARGPRAEVAR